MAPIPFNTSSHSVTTNTSYGGDVWEYFSLPFRGKERRLRKSFRTSKTGKKKKKKDAVPGPHSASVCCNSLREELATVGVRLERWERIYKSPGHL